MNSFDTNDFHKHKMIQIDDYPLTFKPTLEIFSNRNSTSNYISNSSMNQSNIFPNKSTNNKNHRNFLYSNNITEISDISKKNLEYDIQLAALKKKLSSVKEQRKQSEIKVNLMKLRINKLQNEEKASLRELKNITKSIQKIKINRVKAIQKDINRNFNQNKIKNNFVKNKTISFINDNSSISFFSNSNLKEKSIKIHPHNIINISLERNNLNKNFQKNFTPKTKFLSNPKGLNNSNSKINKNNISKDNYGSYSFRNESINVDKLSFNKNTSKNKVKNRVIPNSIPHINKNVKNDKSKPDLKSQVKKNLENKLKSDEEERKRIQEEIRKIEKQQYDLWMNFNENMNNENYNSNINNNFQKNIKKDLLFKDEEDNLVNYNFY